MLWYKLVTNLPPSVGAFGALTCFSDIVSLFLGFTPLAIKYASAVVFQFKKHKIH